MMAVGTGKKSGASLQKQARVLALCGVVWVVFVPE